MKKFRINYSEIIRYREFEIEAEDKNEADMKFREMDLEKEVGISDVETEDFTIEEIK